MSPKDQRLLRHLFLIVFAFWVVTVMVLVRLAVS